MQASKKVPFENPAVLNGVRALYVVSNLIIAGIYLYVQNQINKKRGTNMSDSEKWQDVSLTDDRSDCTQVR